MPVPEGVQGVRVPVFEPEAMTPVWQEHLFPRRHETNTNLLGARYYCHESTVDE